MATINQRRANGVDLEMTRNKTNASESRMGNHLAARFHRFVLRIWRSMPWSRAKFRRQTRALVSQLEASLTTEQPVFVVIQHEQLLSPDEVTSLIAAVQSLSAQVGRTSDIELVMPDGTTRASNPRDAGWQSLEWDRLIVKL